LEVEGGHLKINSYHRRKITEVCGTIAVECNSGDETHQRQGSINERSAQRAQRGGARNVLSGSPSK